jgi:hypothetical protein
MIEFIHVFSNQLRDKYWLIKTRKKKSGTDIFYQIIAHVHLEKFYRIIGQYFHAIGC